MRSAKKDKEALYVFEIVADVFVGNERQDVLIEDYVTACSTSESCQKVKRILAEVQGVFPDLALRIRRIEREIEMQDEV